MIWNIALLFLLFGAAKKKFNPYAAAVIFGAIKGTLYFIGSRSAVTALVAFLVFGALAASMIYFLARVDRKEVAEDPYPKFGNTAKSGPFKWEYVPLSAIVVLLVFGELIVSMLFL